MFNNLKFVVIIIIVIVAAAIGLFYWYQTSNAEIGNLNIYSGSVELVRDNSSQSATTGSGINLSDIIKVAPDSRISIILKDDSIIRLEAGSEIEVSNIEYDGRKIKNAFFHLRMGRIWSNVMPLAEDGNYKVETPTMVAAVRGTKFNVDYLNGLNKIFSFDNKIEVVLKNDRENKKDVNANQLLSDFTAGPVLVPAEYVDDWIIFNLKEDGVAGTEIQSLINLSQITSSTITKTPIVRQIPKPVENKNNQPIKKVVSLKLSVEKNTAFIGEPIALRVTAEYSDGTIIDVTKNILFSQKISLGQIDNMNNFRGFSAGTTVLMAHLDGINSNPVEINIIDQRQEQQQHAQETQQLQREQ